MKNILIFPCGSEVGLEINRSLKYSTHFKLFGGSSVDDHGRFAFDNYIDRIPFHNEPNFIETIQHIIQKHRIDAIYPAMDAVAETFRENEDSLDCRLIGSPAETTQICASKKKTYDRLKNCVPVAKQYDSLSSVEEFPIFIKPDRGYGSRNVYLAKDNSSAEHYLKKANPNGDFVLCEYLPGEEYTVDCFTNRHGTLLFCGGRKRARISNGISVNTKPAKEHADIFNEFAQKINNAISLRGAWFFQLKLDKKNNLKLMEVAARLGGSSSLFRSQGVNFALLSAFDCFDINVEIFPNTYETELDRALSSKFILSIDYSTVYLDFDDCLVIKDKINCEMINFIFSALNQGKKIILITKHADNIHDSLKKYRIQNIFDQIIHIKSDEQKTKYIDPYQAIFIDDSHAERISVKRKYGIPVFSPDMIEALLD